MSNKIKITMYSKDYCFACETLQTRLQNFIEDEELIILKDDGRRGCYPYTIIEYNNELHHFEGTTKRIQAKIQELRDWYK